MNPPALIANNEAPEPFRPQTWRFRMFSTFFVYSEKRSVHNLIPKMGQILNLYSGISLKVHVPALPGYSKIVAFLSSENRAAYDSFKELFIYAWFIVLQQPTPS